MLCEIDSISYLIVGFFVLIAVGFRLGLAEGLILIIDAVLPNRKIEACYCKLACDVQMEIGPYLIVGFFVLIADGRRLGLPAGFTVGFLDGLDMGWVLGAADD